MPVSGDGLVGPDLDPRRGRRARRRRGPRPRRRAGRLVSARRHPSTAGPPGRPDPAGPRRLGRDWSRCHQQDSKRGTLRCASRRHSRSPLTAAAGPQRLRRRRRTTQRRRRRRWPETADIRVWLNGTDTPQEARDWLKKTFEDQNPGSTLTIEEQQWEGLVEKLTTSLSSESETPDVVEIGNTQAPTFTAAGAFSDLTDDLADWGGDDLLPGFVDGATVDGTTYAVPVLRRVEVHLLPQGPLREGRPRGADHDGRVRRHGHRPQGGQPRSRRTSPASGSPARTGATAPRSSGTPAATSPSSDGDAWEGSLSAPESVAGLETVQKLFEEASGAPKDGNEADP